MKQPDMEEVPGFKELFAKSIAKAIQEMPLEKQLAGRPSPARHAPRPRFGCKSTGGAFALRRLDFERALAQTDLEGARRAQELYGDDEDRELAAMAAGTHPFHRELGADALAASKREAAELLASGA